MNRPPLPVRFEVGDTAYQLMYIPGLPADADPRYAVPPATNLMRALDGRTQPVSVPGVGRRFMSWGIMEQPAKPGTAIPPRRFLFLRISETPVPLEVLNPQDMVCYAMQPLHPVSADPIQSIIDALFGTAAVEKQA